ncbi:MAG: LysR substrate-binding domain-containing protein [Alphaproteobacteria bacterium]
MKTAKLVSNAQLRAFHAVATTGSFTRAALQLSVTQPSISSQVKALEDNFGVELFERVGRAVRPSAIGKLLLDVTARYFNLEREAVDVLRAGRELRAGRLAIGADSPNHVLSHLAEWSRRHPDIAVSVRMGNTENLLASLFSYEADIVVVANLAPDARLYGVLLRRDPMVILVGHNHRLAARSGVRLADLAGERLVLRERGSATRGLTETALGVEGVRPGAVIEMDGRQAVCDAVAAGLGVAIISAAEVPRDDTLRVLAISGARLEMTEHVACLLERRAHRAVKSFLDLVESRLGA